ncbi:protein-arginine deiminase domain-containing protein [Spirillospora sp. CA-294931]|uniref:protein-arginine deiminase domain-containing protein n=1 Tax=Spirillospora sp. CA-294931 TaxID=3240042 RepID=UPI003D8F4F1A
MPKNSENSGGRRIAVAGVVALGLGACGLAVVPPALAVPGEHADLRADVDRDGRVDLGGTSDEAGEDVWTRGRGAIVLPNLDDDARRCPVKTPAGRPLPIGALTGCNDASDAVVNGERDAADLARVRVAAMPRLSDKATGTVALTGKGRLFLRQGRAWRALRPTDRIPVRDLRRGAELGLEATDVVRDVRRWNGDLRVRFTVTDGGTTTADTILARVAPLLTHHHLQRTERVLVTRLPDDNPYAKLQRKFVNELAGHVRAAGVAAPLFTFTKYGDPWAQDFVEPGYVSMPGPGRPQSMRIMIRSAQPTRDSGRELWERLRGPNVGAVQLPNVPESENDSLNSTGNLETIPPYGGYPAGRIIMGQGEGPGQRPTTMLAFLAAQGAQQPLTLDTSWLDVGHVDEFLQFLPAPTPRGWRLAVADPSAGTAILRKLQAEGHGKRRVFSVPGGPKTTIAQALADAKLREANTIASSRIAANVAKLKRETGVTDAEIVRIPGLYAFGGGPTQRVRRFDQKAASGETRSAPKTMGAWVPGAINSLFLSPNRVLAARQWGPVVNGRDVFADAVTSAYRRAGVQAAYIDDWHTYHAGGGEVHCGTNSFRATSAPWWS